VTAPITPIQPDHPQQAAIRLRQVSCERGGRELFNIDYWRLPAGEHGLLEGPSGCGKTTLLHLIAGLETGVNGEINVLGHDPGQLGSRQRDRFRASHIGLIFQDFHLLEGLTVEANLRLGGWLGRRGDNRQAARELLVRLGLSSLAHQYPHTLSQGEKQRVAIARALINQPPLILADEPTSALDDANTDNVIGLLLEEADSHGASLLVASHDSRLRKHFSHRIELAGPQ